MEEEHRVKEQLWGGPGLPWAAPCLFMPLVLLACHFSLCLSPHPQDKVWQSLEQQSLKKEKVAKPVGARPSALDRFVR